MVAPELTWVRIPSYPIPKAHVAICIIAKLRVLLTLPRVKELHGFEEVDVNLVLALISMTSSAGTLAVPVVPNVITGTMHQTTGQDGQIGNSLLFNDAQSEYLRINSALEPIRYTTYYNMLV